MAKSFFIVSETVEDFEWKQVEKFGSLGKAEAYTERRERTEQKFNQGLPQGVRQYLMIERV